jgi:hypothetical protein
MNEKARVAAVWLAVGVVGVGVLIGRHHERRSEPYASGNSLRAYADSFRAGWPDESGPARAVALPGGGTSDGDRCGEAGFHHFSVPASSGVGYGPDGAPPPGPQLVLGAYGFGQTSADDGHFTFTLDLAAVGATDPVDLAPPLGPQGVSVEIEGPDGLVGGAYGLPVVYDGPRGPGGGIRIGPRTGVSADVTLPVLALCPGHGGFEVSEKLNMPIDEHNTIIGQPPYTLTVSVSDPEIGRLRRSVHSPVPGDVLSADNRMPANPASGIR